MAKQDEKKCHLCHTVSFLRKSHIVPRCMTRLIHQPRKKVFRICNSNQTKNQDTIKVRMLCNDCEMKFSKFETYFSNSLKNCIGQEKIVYEKDFYLLLISIFWRHLEFVDKFQGIPVQSLSSFLPNIMESMRVFLTSDTFLAEQFIYLFLLDDDQKYDFQVLKARSKINNITYSSYCRFVNGKDVADFYCRKDSATNYSLIKKALHSIEQEPFSYFNIFYVDYQPVLFLIVEKLIFILDVDNKLEFSERAQIKESGGVWSRLQLPAIINEYLDSYGEQVNHDVSLSVEEYALLINLAKSSVF